MFDNFERAQKKLNQLLSRKHWDLLNVDFKPDKMIFHFVVFRQGVLTRETDNFSCIEIAKLDELVDFIIYSDGTIDFD